MPKKKRWSLRRFSLKNIGIFHTILIQMRQDHPTKSTLATPLALSKQVSQREKIFRARIQGIGSAIAKHLFLALVLVSFSGCASSRELLGDVLQGAAGRTTPTEARKLGHPEWSGLTPAQLKIAADLEMRNAHAGYNDSFQSDQEQQQRSQPANEPTPTPPPGYKLDESTVDRRSVCSNDYDCAYGSSCVKDQFKLRGICAKKVDSYGIPTLTPPNPNSIGVGVEGDCLTSVDCPVGFKCVKGSVQVYGHCFK